MHGHPSRLINQEAVMKLRNFALYTLLGCVSAVPLAFAQSDTAGAKPEAEATGKAVAKQHTAGVPQGLVPDAGTAFKQHTAGVPLSMTPNPGNAYEGNKNQ
jgi:hypothetical protein